MYAGGVRNCPRTPPECMGYKDLSYDKSIFARFNTSASASVCAMRRTAANTSRPRAKRRKADRVDPVVCPSSPSAVWVVGAARAAPRVSNRTLARVDAPCAPDTGHRGTGCSVVVVTPLSRS